MNSITLVSLLQKYFPKLVPTYRRILYKLEKVPQLPLKDPVTVKIYNVSFLWWVKNRKDLWMSSNKYAEIRQLVAMVKAVTSIDKCCVWDIGSAQGIYTLAALAAGAHVVAFEPYDKSRNSLKDNIELNGYSKKVQLMEIALGDSSGKMAFFTGNTSPSLIKNQQKHDTEVSIDVTTVDKLIKKGTPRPSIMKIDVEGFELNILNGAVELLGSDNRPTHLFIEIHDYYLKEMNKSHQDIFDLLEGYGYIRIISDELREGERLLCHFRA